MKENEYQCAMCGKVYKKVRNKEWSDKQAREEHDSNFPGESFENAAVVCDDCYQEMISTRPTRMTATKILAKLKEIIERFATPE